MVESDAEHPIRSMPEYSSLHNLLDCYMYLKLYSVWGTERVGHLREQVELYQHVVNLWKEVGHSRALSTSKKSRTSRSDVDQVLISDAVNILRGDLDRRLGKYCQDGDLERVAKILAFTLVQDQLLFPSDEFVKSMKEEEDDEGKIPKDLIRIWVPVLNVVFSRGMSTELCRALMSKAEENASAAEWLKIILAPPTTENGNWSGKKRGDKRCHVVLEPSVLENDSGKWRTLLEETLMTPSPSGMRVLPLMLRLQCPRLEAGKERSLLALMGSFLQPAAAGGNTNTSAVDRNQDDHEATDLDIKTLRDVLPPDGDGAGDGGESVWAPVSTCAPEWRECPLGLLPGQSGQDLDGDWLEDELEEASNSKASSYCEATSLDWPSLVTAAAKKRCPGFDSDPEGGSGEGVPAFYRSNGSCKRQWR